MKNLLEYALVAIFSIFLGSQITEGVLLVPYWQSLAPAEFYEYYQQFGPSIGLFYTILTIVAAAIPILLTLYWIKAKPSALTFSILSSLFAILFVACFYVYFKDTNELFYQAALNEVDLQKELITWKQWHWGRIVLEALSLIFLFFALGKKK